MDMKWIFLLTIGIALLFSFQFRYVIVGTGAVVAYKLDRWTGEVEWVHTTQSGIVKNDQ